MLKRAVLVLMLASPSCDRGVQAPEDALRGEDRKALARYRWFRPDTLASAEEQLVVDPPELPPPEPSSLFGALRHARVPGRGDHPTLAHVRARSPCAPRCGVHLAPQPTLTHPSLPQPLLAVPRLLNAPPDILAGAKHTSRVSQDRGAAARARPQGIERGLLRSAPAFAPPQRAVVWSRAAAAKQLLPDTQPPGAAGLAASVARRSACVEGRSLLRAAALALQGCPSPLVELEDRTDACLVPIACLRPAWPLAVTRPTVLTSGSVYTALFAFALVGTRLLHLDALCTLLSHPATARSAVAACWARAVLRLVTAARVRGTRQGPCAAFAPTPPHPQLSHTLTHSSPACRRRQKRPQRT